jgi:hypothetical protein
VNPPDAGRIVHLQWQGLGRVFQLEKAREVTGPFVPASPVMPDSAWIDPMALPAATAAFYRLRQW